MTKKLVGLFASVALLGSGMALADDKTGEKRQSGAQQQQQTGQDIGGSPTPGQPGQGTQAGVQEITGLVVDVGANMVHIHTQNGVLPLQVNRQTQIQDPTIKRVQDLKEGQRVRASFIVRGKNNVAQSISLETGQRNQDIGGTGLDIEQGQDPQPMPRPGEVPEGGGGSGRTDHGSGSHGSGVSPSPGGSR